MDDTGCRVTRGFVLPSRSSSADSSDSSLGAETPGTPASPLQDATPGFKRPTGSLYHAPEMAILRSHSDASLHKPTDMGQFQRPPQLGARSQTFNGRRASCWRVSEQEPSEHRVASALTQGLQSSDHLAKLRKSMRRTQSDQTGLMLAANAPDIRPEEDAKSSCAIVSSLDEDNAIADSEDDNEEDDPSRTNMAHVSGIAAQRNRPTYAQRRAMSDQRIHRQKAPSPLSLVPPVQRVTTVVASTVGGYVLAEHDRVIETPVEIKSFVYGEMVPDRALRPSRSRPRPSKGVLKKAGGRSPSEDPAKHVHTSIRRDSGAVFGGSAASQAKYHSQME